MTRKDDRVALRGAIFATALLLATACGSAEQPAALPPPAQEPVVGTAPAVAQAKSPSSTPEDAGAKPMPTLGDPLGLLSKSTKAKDLTPPDPGALMGQSTAVTSAIDPRAVLHGPDERPKLARKARSRAAKRKTRAR